MHADELQGEPLGCQGQTDRDPLQEAPPPSKSKGGGEMKEEGYNGCYAAWGARSGRVIEQ